MYRFTAHMAKSLMVLTTFAVAASTAEAQQQPPRQPAARQAQPPQLINPVARQQTPPTQPAPIQRQPAPVAQPAQPAPPATPAEHTNQLAAEGKNKQLCESVADRVFVRHDLGSECIAYYATPGTPQYRPAVLYFEGDVPASEFQKADFSASYLADMRVVFQRLATQTGVRFVFVSRPGVFGSSGNHAARRSIGEMLAMNGAVDAIKTRLGLTEIVLAGQSGGSTISAALLTLGRRDVTCAILGSGLLSVVDIEYAHRVREKLPEIMPSLLHVYLFDPTDRLQWVERQANRRIFVLGDPTDTRTPFPQQRGFADSIRRFGHHAVAYEVTGQGELMHGVAHHTLPAAAQCARGASDAAIQQVVAPQRPAARTQTSQVSQ